MKQTDYTRSVTLACSSAGMPDANSLATLMGQNPQGDMRTFKAPTYTKDGTEYAVTHTVVKPTFLEPTQTGTLPLIRRTPCPRAMTGRRQRRPLPASGSRAGC